MKPVVGIIANPVSARDIRRVVANAASLQIADRANIVLRVLAALAACGIEQVLMMPERGGIAGHVARGIERSRNQGEHRFPRVAWLDMAVTGTVEDTRGAARLLHKAGVAAIVVLGGDGTHRAVVSQCAAIPIAGISTGTNNAFPEHREPTMTGLATALAVLGRVPREIAFTANKTISVAAGDRTDIALVDAAFVTDGYAGARAVWRMDTLRELFVTFADPEVIGLSAIAGLIEPVSRRSPGGLMVRVAPPRQAPMVIGAPVAPGLIEQVGVADWRRMPAGVPFAPMLTAGSIALDGEREWSFTARDKVSVTLVGDAFRSLDVAAVMKFSAVHGLMRQTQRPSTDHLSQTVNQET
ncbi:MAG: NAD(+)/NADH kinase [Alphaproteobacteria bacterium]|nr:NAD(+)/NADH kinase [Alphaproteobacteria bacterium]